MSTTHCPNCGTPVPAAALQNGGSCPKCYADLRGGPSPHASSRTPPGASAPGREWYYAKNGARQGPVSSARLKELATSGTLQATDLVWHSGVENWFPAGEVRGLFPDRTGTGSSAPPPPLPMHREEGQTPDQFRAALAGGSQFAQKLISQGADQLKRTFGAAFKSTLVQAGSSLRQLFRHPIKITFYTFVFLLSCLLSFWGILTILLVPIWVLGYVTVIGHVVKGEETSLASMIAFMRHGWDTLWHIVMLFASFVVTISAMLAPFAIALLLVYVLFGTGSAAVIQAIALAPAAENKSDSSARGGSADGYRNSTASSSFNRDQVGSGRDTSHSAKDGESVFSSLFSSMASAGTRAVVFIFAICVAIFIYAPLTAAAILCYFLVLDVAQSQHDGQQRFDLVYASFGRMLTIAKAEWKRLVCSGLFLALLWQLVAAVISLLSDAAINAGLIYASSWLVLVVLPLWMTVFTVYANVYVTMTCLDFRNGAAADTDGQ